MCFIVVHPYVHQLSIKFADKLVSYSGSNVTVNVEVEEGAEGALDAAISTAATLTNEWKSCVDELRESYLLADENYKYLGTLQEFLLVSRDILNTVERIEKLFYSVAITITFQRAFYSGCRIITFLGYGVSISVYLSRRV